MANQNKAKVRRDGSIIRKGDRKFLLRAYRGTTADGKRVYFTQVFKGSAEDAQKRLQEIHRDISNGIVPTRTIPEPEKPQQAPATLGDTLDRWLKHKTATRKARTRTIANYEWLLNKYVRPVLGERAILEITESDIQDLYNGILESGTVTAKTIRNLHKVLEPAFTRAVGWKLRAENPCEHVELPVWDREEAKYLTPEQTRAFLTAARSDKWFVALLIAIETGARPNEYLALRWHDINFDERSLRIRRSVYWPPGGGFEFTKPKTQRSVRTKTISARAYCGSTGESN